MFCQHCGSPVDQVPDVAVIEEREPVEVVLARIQADRDVQVARIEANARRAELATAETIAETEADAQVDSAEAVAEIITATADDSEPEPEPDPLVIDAPTAVVDDVVDDAPPAEGSPVPEEKRKGASFGMW